MKICYFVVILLGILISCNAFSENAQIISEKNTDGFDSNFSKKQEAVLNFFINNELYVIKKGGDAAFSSALPIQKVATAQEIIETYRANEVRGQKLYNDKKVLVTGNILRINAGIGNSVYLTLGKGRFLGLSASFKNPNINKIAALKKGDTVSLLCVGNGAMGNSPILTGCVFFESLRDEFKFYVTHAMLNKDVDKKARLMSLILYSQVVIISRHLSDKTKCGISILDCKKEIHKIESNPEYKNDTLKSLKVGLHYLKMHEINDSFTKKIKAAINKLK